MLLTCYIVIFVLRKTLWGNSRDPLQHLWMETCGHREVSPSGYLVICWQTTDLVNPIYSYNAKDVIVDYLKLVLLKNNRQ